MFALVCLFSSFLKPLLTFCLPNSQTHTYTLTENNKVFFNGKSIFTLNETYGSKIRSIDNGSHCVTKHNYEINDFQKHCLDDQENLDDLVDIVAGHTHFLVLTSKDNGIETESK